MPVIREPGNPAAGGRLPQNLLNFARLLRSAGLPVGADQLLSAGEAVRQVGLASRERVYWALRATLVREPGQFEVFDQAFRLYFRNPRLLEQLMGQLLPTLQRPVDGEAGRQQVARRLRDALGQEGGDGGDSTLLELDRSGTSSRAARLARKDFAQMTADQYAEALEWLRHDWQLLRPQPTRRSVVSRYRGRLDLRATTRRALRHGLDGALPVWERTRPREPALVLLIDVSGSVSAYGRAFLQFAHLLTHRSLEVRSFVFGTQLTDISRPLLLRDPDRALAAVSAAVPDWDGGTRIADSLRSFNTDWARRVLTRPTTVLILTDGLEHGEPQALGREMGRLKRRTRQLWWLNPLLRYEGFEPLAGGIRAMQPHADRLIPCHTVDSLRDLVALLRKPSRGMGPGG